MGKVNHHSYKSMNNMLNNKQNDVYIGQETDIGILNSLYIQKQCDHLQNSVQRLIL